MNIGHYIWTLNVCGGGPPISGSSTAAHQKKSGMNVTILTSCYVTEERINDITEEIEVTLPPIVRVDGWIKAIGILKALDVCHIHNIWRLDAIFIAVFCTVTSKPFVLSPRGSLDDWAIEKGGLKRQVVLQVLEKIWKKASFIHYLSNSEKQCSTINGFKRVVVVPNGVASSKVFPRDANRGGPTKILYLSRMAEKKRPLAAIRVVAELIGMGYEIEFEMAGDGELFEECKQLVSSLSLGDSIFFSGAVSGIRKVNLLKEADLLFHPTLQEGMSMTILEAMAHRTLVVTTTGANMPQISDLGLGLVSSIEEDDVSQMLLFALNLLMNDAHQEYLHKAYEYVVDNHSWEFISRTLADQYQSE